MITIKQLMESRVTTSIDRKHWEPVLPKPPFFMERLRDAVAVFLGNATAIRQTTLLDITQNKVTRK